MTIKGLKQNLRKGFNLIEAAIVLAVVGLVVGGIWIAASAVYENMRESNAQQQLLQVVQNTRNLYYGQAAMSGTDMTQTLLLAKVFPGDMVRGTDILNPWNGAVSVRNRGGTAFEVTFEDLPRSACIELSTKNSKSGRDIGMVEIAVNGTATNTAAGVELLVEDASTQCQDGNVNQLLWAYNLRG